MRGTEDSPGGLGPEERHNMDTSLYRAVLKWTWCTSVISGNWTGTSPFWPILFIY